MDRNCPSHDPLSSQALTSFEYRRNDNPARTTSLLLLHDLNALTHRRPAIMFMVLPTPLPIIPPRCGVSPLPLQPPHQLPQKPFIPAILRRCRYQHNFSKAQRPRSETGRCEKRRRKRGVFASQTMTRDGRRQACFKRKGKEQLRENTYRMSLNQRVRLLPTPHINKTPPSNKAKPRKTHQTNK